MMEIKKILRKIAPNFILVLVGRYKLARDTEFFSGHPLRCVFRVARWTVYEWLGADISFTTPDGTPFVSMPNNYSSFVVYFTNYRDPAIHAFLRRRLTPDSIFVDAGANIGTYTVRASQLIGQKGKVIAIEAHPFTYHYLLKNIALNNLRNVTALNVALGAKRGTAEMSYTKSNAGETHVAVSGEEKISVPLQTLDEVLQELGIPIVNYLKIDVEGFEFPLLVGAEKTIATSPGIIVQTELNESHPRRYGRSITEVIDLLFTWGLAPHEVDIAGNSKIIKRSEIKMPSDILWWRGK